MPKEHQPFGYDCLIHGLGMSGEHPYVPLRSDDAVDYNFEGEFLPNMVVCVESYIGCSQTHQGVKLEDQFLITQDGAECLTTHPFDERLAR